jgi:hypothetical protein
MATITAQDGTGDSTTPTLIEGFEASSESGNIIEDLIGGGIAVTVLGEGLRNGQFQLKYADDASAEQARLLLGRPCAFVLNAPERSILNMTFVRQGYFGTTMQRVRSLWAFSVGFHEIDPDSPPLIPEEEP